MDASKLKNSCICGNTSPYLECCGPFSSPASGAGPQAEFRHALHELYMYLFPLRNLYQAYWERLSQDSYPHHLLMADPEYGRAVVANFFWDYSVQFSDARAILRAARDIEGKNMRMANDFRQWGLAPFWLYFVVEGGATHGHLRMLGTQKLLRVEHGGELPPPGVTVAARILPYRGRDFLQPAVLALPAAASEEAVAAKLDGICRALGVKSGAGLRPDVHCDEWRRHGALFLSLWRELVYDAIIGVPARTVRVAPAFALPAAGAEAARQLERGGALPLAKGRYELRHRALPLARLELRGETVQVALMDPAFRSHVLRWLADHLGTADPAAETGTEDPAGDAPAASMDAWVHTPLAFLNGQTPLEASAHDFGRRRLQELMKTFVQKGRDVSGLKRQLGL